MSYHPIIGILTLVLCVVLAYFIGKVITRNNILSWRKTKDDKDSTIEVIGDASSPDAPWMEKDD